MTTFNCVPTRLNSVTIAHIQVIATINHVMYFHTQKRQSEKVCTIADHCAKKPVATMLTYPWKLMYSFTL